MSCWGILESEAKGKICTTETAFIYTLDMALILKLLSGELAEIQILKLYHQRFWFSNSGMELRNLHFTE